MRSITPQNSIYELEQSSALHVDTEEPSIQDAEHLYLIVTFVVAVYANLLSIKFIADESGDCSAVTVK